MIDYVENRDGGFWVKGKRISLDSVVYAFRRGQSPESILQSFPLLTLEEIYGSITFYLANQQDVDQSILEDEAAFEKMHQEERKRNSQFYERLEKARSELVTQAE